MVDGADPPLRTRRGAGRAVYVERLGLRNFGAVATSDVGFVNPAEPGAGHLDVPNVNVIVGTNGSGKSTVLRALASTVVGALPAREPATAVDGWIRLGSQGPAGARAELRTADGRVRGEVLVLSGAPFDEEPRPVRGEEVRQPELLLGYGANRLASGARLEPADGFDRVESLFDVPGSFAPVEDLFELMELGDRQEAARLLSALLPDDIDVRVDDGRPGFYQRGVAVPPASLSDGTRSFLAWVVDLLFHLTVLGGGLDAAVPATVLVDEVDQRMHPRWQRDVLHRLSQRLPSVQLIVTAQSPLVIGGLRPENLHVLEEDLDADGAGAMRVRRLHEDVFGLSADQVLSSSYFELDSPRAGTIRQELTELSGLAHDDPDAALAAMRLLASPNSRTLPAPLVDRRRRRGLRDP